MKIEPISMGTYTGPAPIQDLKAEESNSSLDEYDETRIAVNPLKQKVNVANPIEKKQGTVEDLISLQKATEKMAQSYGFASVAEAQEATSGTSSVTAPSAAVAPVSGASSSGINA